MARLRIGNLIWHMTSWFKQRRIKRSSKLVRLNLGCGSKSLDGYLNIDIRKTGPFVMYGDVRDLWFVNPEQAAVVVAFDLFEHINPWYAEDVLKMWLSKLRHGGFLYLQVPDLKKQMQMYLSGKWDAEKLSRQLIGVGDYGDDVPGGLGHKAAYDEERLRKLLTKHGCEVKHIGHLETKTTYNLFVIAQKL